MIRIRQYEKHLWAVSCATYSPALYKAAKMTPGLRWEPATRSWVGFIDAVAACANLLMASGIRLDGVVERPDKEAPSALPIGYGEARDYQKEAIRFLLREAPTGALLADDLGLGKSLCALRAARALRLPTVVVCPAFVQGVWGDDEGSESYKWWREAYPPRVLEGVRGGRYVVRCEGPPDNTPDNASTDNRWLGARPPENAEKLNAAIWANTPEEAFEFGSLAEAQEDVKLAFSNKTLERLRFDAVPIEPALLTVCNDAILYAWAPHMSWCRFLILDEVHHAANDKSRRSKAMRLLASFASHRVGLSGTPMTNRPKDLWNVVDTLAEGRFGKFFPYCLRYADAHREEVAKNKVVWKFDGSSNLDELRSRLDFFMLRRTKADVGMALPEKTRQLIWLDVKRRAVTPTRQLVVDGKINDKAFRKALDMAADGKLADVVALVAGHVEDDHRVVVFTWRRAIAEYICNSLTAMGVKATFIHGELGQKERTSRMKSEWQVLCATIDVTAGGISLTQADVAVFAELTYEPHEILQCEGRISRFGQQRRTLFQYPLARGTADELVARVVIDKMDVFEKTIGDTGEGWQKTMRGETDRKKILKALAARLAAQEDAA
jgi:superfamily II DNA or RNA helicase